MLDGEIVTWHYNMDSADRAMTRGNTRRPGRYSTTPAEHIARNLQRQAGFPLPGTQATFASLPAVVIRNFPVGNYPRTEIRYAANGKTEVVPTENLTF